jgi:hypothetical protein
MDICKRPVAIKNQWYEFMEFGTGLRPNCRDVCGISKAFERGEWSTTVVTNKDLVPPNKKIRLYPADPVDMSSGKRVLLQGLDANGVAVYSQDGLTRVDGVFYELAGPFVESDREFTKLTGIQKDQTQGPVHIFSVDTITGEETLLVILEASEEVACYRRLYLGGLPSSCCGKSTIQVVAMVKLEYIPAIVPTDYLLIQSLPALIEEAQSLRYEGIDSPVAKQMAAMHHGMALKYLFGQLDLYVGKERVSISLPLWGSDRLRPQPI